MPEDTRLHYYRAGKTYCGAPHSKFHGGCPGVMEKITKENLREQLDPELMFCIHCGRDRCEECWSKLKQHILGE